MASAVLQRDLAMSLNSLNVLRVWGDVDRISKRLKDSRTPALEDDPAKLGVASTYDT